MENEMPCMTWIYDDNGEKWVANIQRDKLIETKDDGRKIYEHTTQKGKRKRYIYNKGEFTAIE